MGVGGLQSSLVNTLVKSVQKVKCKKMQLAFIVQYVMNCFLALSRGAAIVHHAPLFRNPNSPKNVPLDQNKKNKS